MKRLIPPLLAGTAVFGVGAALLLTRTPTQPVTSFPENVSGSITSIKPEPVAQRESHDGHIHPPEIQQLTAPDAELSLNNSPAFADELQRILDMEDSEAKDRALANLLQQWVTRDALAAANFVQTIESPVLREDITRRVIRAWTDQDLTAALSWSAQLSDLSERETALGHVCRQVSERDPQQAVQLALTYHLDDSQSGLLENLTAQWTAKDFTAALDWAKTRTDGQQRDGLMAQVAYVRSQTNPADAARLVVEQMTPSGEAQAEAVISVLHQWALRDPSGASTWAASFPESPLRERAMSELIAIASHRTTAANP